MERKHVPHITRSYLNQRDTFSKDNGLLMKGQCIIIPTSNEHRPLTDLHLGYQGTMAVQCNVHLTVYWPGIDVDIKDFINRCPSCPINRPSHRHKTTHSPDITGGPWGKISMDFFDHDGHKYLATVDYLSTYPYLVTVTNTVHTINYLKDIFSTEGVPSELMSDNGPPFSRGKFVAFFQT